MTTLNFVRKGTEFIKSAVQKDNNEEYEEALSEYTKGIQYLMTGYKYEKNQKVRNAIKEKVHKYLMRAEKIKESLPSNNKKKKKKKRKYSYPSNEYINETVKETKYKEMHIVYGYFHENEKLLNINYDIPNGIINLCLVYYHKPEKIHIPTKYNSIVIETPSVKWDDVIGLSQAKQILKEKIILPIKFPSLFNGNNASHSKFIMLYGPPGCGKSYIAKAVGHEANNATFFQVSTSDFVCKYDGMGEIKQLFQFVLDKKPSIVVFDEFDSMCNGSYNDFTVNRRLKTEFLIQLLGLKSKGISDVHIIGCTNVPWQVKSDKAINRRIDHRIYIGMPSKDDRERMVESYMDLSNVEHNLSQQDWGTLAELTHGFSGADINGVWQDVLMEPVRELQLAKYFKRVYKNEDDTDTNHYKLVPCKIEDDSAFQISLMEFSDEDQQRVRTNPIEMSHFLKVLEQVHGANDEDIARHLQFAEDWNDE